LAHNRIDFFVCGFYKSQAEILWQKPEKEEKIKEYKKFLDA
jgi:uncharacterized protein with ATP-grasp and redox domains